MGLNCTFICILSASKFPMLVACAFSDIEIRQHVAFDKEILNFMYVIRNLILYRV